VGRLTPSFRGLWFFEDRPPGAVYRNSFFVHTHAPIIHIQIPTPHTLSIKVDLCSCTAYAHANGKSSTHREIFWGVYISLHKHIYHCTCTDGLHVVCLLGIGLFASRCVFRYHSESIGGAHIVSRLFRVLRGIYSQWHIQVSLPDWCYTKGDTARPFHLHVQWVCVCGRDR